jgi:hypothetical protein
MSRSPYASSTHGPRRCFRFSRPPGNRAIPRHQDTALAQHPQGRACGLLELFAVAALDGSEAPQPLSRCSQRAGSSSIGPAQASRTAAAEFLAIRGSERDAEERCGLLELIER